MRICYVVAMVAEAKPFIERYGLKEVEAFFAPLPCRLYEGEVNGSILDVVLNGQQNGSDLVGCEAASVATLSAIQKLSPDLIINSGTCGAFKGNGASIAEVYIGNGVMFHDRRVPGDDTWGTQSLGNYAVWEGSEEMAKSLGYKTGKVTTGSSLDMQPCDLEVIQKHGGQLKDMEGAAVGFVCSLLHVPILYVKSVTDLCDSGAETFEEFSKNLHQACETLREANERVINYLTTF
ncbi:MAG: 5'-methylthioadenosine nucleosidase [Bacteroidales bacterium]|nr:5'-methylthioadenosine nucleosidase [Bacteroidales bacterium]